MKFEWNNKPDWVTSWNKEMGSFGKEIIVVEVKYHDVTFNDLSLLSEIFNTKDINVGSEAREGGYCETCRYSYSVSVITIMNAGRMP